MRLTENDLRLLVRSILREQQAEVDPGFSIEPAYPDRFQNASAAKKARILLAILQDLGLPVEKIVSAGSNELRFGLRKGSNPPDLKSAVELAFQEVLDGDDVDVDVIPPNVSPNPSGTYDAYSIEGQPLVIFGGAGLSTGARKKGYEYEEDIEKAFKDVGAEITSNKDVTTTDLEVGDTGVELKLPKAQAGEPMLMYDFKTQEFVPTNPKEINQDIASVINRTMDKADTHRRLNKVKSAIQLDADTLARVPKDVFFNVIKPALKDEPNENLSTYEITSSDMRKYYKAKGADVIQIKGKGLYHLTDDDIVRFDDGRETPLFDMDDSALGSVTFRNAKTYYGIRPSLRNDPLSKIEPSPITLDSEEDRKLFANWAEKQSLNETINRWQLLAGVKR